ncbi:hypothetical protein [Variovorax terrae]|uniref:Uncharacterized protein n=1 Tax=Variovorax terrae TaxID=2923278 RepID=A0A9X2AQ90_9BURK|nr:hypothetical protein [Variovorax terrae]MCJ0762906.1 hypothetical protein [Variovorax terrae]
MLCFQATARIALLAALSAALCGVCLTASAQSGGALPQITVTAKANPDPVEKSYRRMIRGMDYFEAHRALAPAAALRFRLYPRARGTDMAGISLDVVGTTADFPVELAADNTFTLARNQKALDENAQVIPDRKARSMTWRADIRTPGLPPGSRRLGDLRLECQVGMEAGLVSDTDSFLGRLASAVMDTPAYCSRKNPRYLFFADRPLFSVTLVHGARREVLPVDKLYAGASDDPALKNELPYCDCEALVDRTYFVPLEDGSWPDDTRVEFEYMEGAP